MTKLDRKPRGVAIDGSLVRQQRQLNGLTMATFAARCEISESFVSLIEGGHRSVSPPVFVRICDVLGVKDRRELLTVAAPAS